MSNFCSGDPYLFLLCLYLGMELLHDRYTYIQPCGKYQTVFQGDCTNLHSQQHGIIVLTACDYICYFSLVLTIFLN
jgi:hypothetical protein